MSLESSLEKLKVANPDLEILHGAEQTLKKGSSKAAELTRLVALIKLERYARAYELTRKSPLDYPTEAAYILYKLGKVVELRKLAKESPLPAVQLALAQAEYRIGNFFAAEHILDKVEIEDEDIPVNLVAIRASRGLDVEGSSFEALFARAYSLLHKNPDLALEVLSEAKQVAADDYDLQCVLIQAAFAQGLAGRPDEARQLLQSVLQGGETDRGLQTVVENNLQSFEPVPTTAEKCQQLLAQYYAHDLANATSAQASAYTLNKLLLQSIAGRRIGHIANTHAELYPSSLAPRVLALQSNTPKQLRQILGRTPGDVAAALALATKLPPREAASVVIDLCSVLAASDKDQLSPGLAGLVVAAYKLQNTPEKIAPMLRVFPLRDSETARYLALSESEADVAKAHEYFANFCDNKIEKVAGLMLTKPETSAAEGVPSVAELTASIDIESLESLGMAPLVVRRLAPVSSGIKKKRSGKPKLPADYDESKQPDPERWLAKMDRSSYKKKKGASQGASQGAATKAPQASPGPVVTSKKNKKKKGKK